MGELTTPTILHASVLLPAAEWGPGLPVLSMRRPWKWARLKVERAGGIWMPDSAPSGDLVDRYGGDAVTQPCEDLDWPAFMVEYRNEMLARTWVLDDLLRWGGTADPIFHRGGLVLLCWERERPDGTLRCHRTVLANLLRDRAADMAPKEVSS